MVFIKKSCIKADTKGTNFNCHIVMTMTPNMNNNNSLRQLARI